MGIDLAWDDRGRRLTLRLADGSRMRPPLERPIEVERIAEKTRSSLPSRAIAGSEVLNRGELTSAKRWDTMD